MATRTCGRCEGSGGGDEKGTICHMCDGEGFIERDDDYDAEDYWDNEYEEEEGEFDGLVDLIEFAEDIDSEGSEP